MFAFLLYIHTHKVAKVNMSKAAVICWLTLGLLVLHCAKANELKDYCSINKFDNLSGGLRFTKEVISTEYANLGGFKAIHCCLRGYRSIEWSVLFTIILSSLFLIIVNLLKQKSSNNAKGRKQ